MASQATSAQSVLKQISSRYVRRVQLDPSGDTEAKKLSGMEIIDPWGNPIRAVHPSFDGGYGQFGLDNSTTIVPATSPGRALRDVTEVRGGTQTTVKYRRSFRPYAALPYPPATWIGDADEGLCANKRMYFYSCGADGNPGGRADNVYTSRPTLPHETAKFGQ